MKDNFKPKQSGNNQPSKFDELADELIKPLTEKLGIFAMPCVYVGEWLGANLSLAIDKFFDDDDES